MAEDKKSKQAKKAEFMKNKKDSETKKVEEVQKVIATRDKLERDYKEDIIKVSFSTSSETTRSVLAKRPSNKEMIQIMKLSAQASKFDEDNDIQALEQMVEIYDRLSEIAAKLSVDDELDEEFWNECVSNTTLQNFVTNLISESQTAGISREELKSFR